MRSGIIAEKVGMTRVFTDEGVHIPVTVLKVDNCEVIGQRTKEKDGYVALQVGAGTAKVKMLLNRNVFSLLRQIVSRKKPLWNSVSVMTVLFLSVVSLGKGFAGVMKRWNFGGDNATHGVSRTHRSGGSTGQRQDPGKVFKNKKMPGHLGAEKVTVQNLQVVELDEEKGLILVKGAVPGYEGNVVVIKDAVKRAVPADVPMPAGLKVKEVAVEVAPEAVETAPVEEVKE